MAWVDVRPQVGMSGRLYFEMDPPWWYAGTVWSVSEDGRVFDFASLGGLISGLPVDGSRFQVEADDQDDV
jgi:hypothetical protein